MTRTYKVALESAARSAATYYSLEFSNEGYKGVILYTNRSAATGTVTVSVEVKDPISGTWATLNNATTLALSGTGLHLLTVHPNVTYDANDLINMPLPMSFRVKAVVATNPVTFSVAAVLVN